MSQSLLIAFVMFATVMFFTPGPNNIMLLSSGLTYGFRRTLPHVAGVTVGFAFMIGAVGLGLGAVFVAFPVLQTILKYAGAAYLIVLGIQTLVRHDPPLADIAVVRADLRRVFTQGVIVNVLNPHTAVFFFAFLPQFVNPSSGHIPLHSRRRPQSLAPAAYIQRPTTRYR